MRRTLVLIALTVLPLLATVPSAHAMSKTSRRTQAPWSELDTAVYVLSTLNLLHTKQGRPLTDLLTRKLAITRYDIYADTVLSDVYFVELLRDDGIPGGVLVYRLGWSVPEIVTLAIHASVGKQAPKQLVAAYRRDAKHLIGSFTSTLPESDA